MLRTPARRTCWRRALGQFGIDPETIDKIKDQFDGFVDLLELRDPANGDRDLRVGVLLAACSLANPHRDDDMDPNASTTCIAAACGALGLRIRASTLRALRHCRRANAVALLPSHC